MIVNLVGVGLCLGRVWVVTSDVYKLFCLVIANMKSEKRVTNMKSEKHVNSHEI